MTSRNDLGILNAEELGAALDVTPTTLETWRGKGLGPNFVKLGRAVFYRLVDVLDWIKSQVVVPENDMPKRDDSPEVDPE